MDVEAHLQFQIELNQHAVDVAQLLDERLDELHCNALAAVYNLQLPHIAMEEDGTVLLIPADSFFKERHQDTL